jgi:electron transfer flavoprotein beta subunit
MHIIVCIKQVPDTTNVRINPETNTLIREGVECIVNPFDMYAIEEAIRLKEQRGGKVTAITMGPPQAESALREALSLGVDEAVLISNRAFAGSDTWATSLTLARAIDEIGNYDLVICGKQAIDGDTAQVGPGIAVHLRIPQITFVKKIEEITDRTIRAERMMEEGYQIVESPLPVLLTVVKEINEPRLPSLRGKMRAKTAKIPVWGPEEVGLDPEHIGLKGSPTYVTKIFTPERKSSGKMFRGDAEEVVDQLLRELRERKLV